MQLSVSGGGLKATTKDHGLTEYWANRLTFCSAPSHFPRIFCWVYRHEGRKLRHELRCHAVLCSSATAAKQIEEQLKASLALALAEFKKDKIFRQNARLSLLNALYEYPTIPRRKILLSSGSYNYKPPLERSKSAPKLTIIEENAEEQDEVGDYRRRNLFQSFSVPSPRNSIQEENLFTQDASQEQQICDVNLKNSLTNTQVENAKDQLEELEKNILVLGNLLHDSLTKELMESCEEKCERTWFTNFNETDILPVDSDEGSLSSGCETSSTVTSEAEPAHFSTIIEVEEDKIVYSEDDYNKNCIKTELDFKVGGSVSNCVRSFDQLTDTNIRKYCWMNSVNNNGVGSGGILNNDQVSLIPLGECHADFSSLKVFKRRHSDNAISENGLYEIRINGDDKEDDKTCDYNDEGYDEALDSPNSVTNVVLI
ncbi:uncharacterized protein LOC112905976 [Agrilus planipennis]|nr:uncharacterized protein LOC112905976 [Agrilus planipennis]